METAKIDVENTILFVGAGVSMHLGLPSWHQLIDEIARQLKYDPRIFELLGTPLSLAEYYELEHGSIGPLRSWMDQEWHHKGVDVSKSEVHEAIAKSGFRKIYTTNFDRWLERACEHWNVNYRKILTANDLALRQHGALEIVKFHGDFDDDKSLVLTESSYLERLNFESPLDLMLRSDILRHPILFIGYSLSDINIRYLFHKLARIWGDAGLSNARPKSYIFMTRPNPIEERIFDKWGIIPIVDQTGLAAKGLTDFLKSVASASVAPSQQEK
jgi:SIR2-like domain